MTDNSWEWLPEKPMDPDGMRLSIAAAKRGEARYGTLSASAYDHLLEFWPWDLPIRVRWATDGNGTIAFCADREGRAQVTPATRRVYLTAVAGKLRRTASKVRLEPEGPMLVLKEEIT